MNFFIIFCLLGLIFTPLNTYCQERGIQVEGVGQSTSSSADSGPVYRGLIIGNNDYRHWDKLETAVQDAEEIYRVLVQMYGFNPDNIRLLKNASRRDMKQGFDFLIKTSTPQDNVLIYYGGHGHMDNTNRGYWVPVECEVDDTYDYVSNAEILDMLGAVQARHKLLISDSCFSGNLLTKQRGSLSGLKKNRYFQEKSKLYSAQGLTSGGSEPVSDGGPKWQGHSIFAYNLLAHLKANQRRCLAANLLGQNVAESVARSSEQTPIIRPIYGQGDQGGEFFFLKRFEIDKKMILVNTVKTDENQAIFSLARVTIHQKLAQLLKDLGYPLMIEQFQMDDTEIDTQLPKLLEKNKADVALTYTIKGNVQKEQSFLWQGKARMTVDLVAYELRKSSVSKIDAYSIKPQVMPLEQWCDSMDFKAKKMNHAAQKLVKKWAHETINDFLMALLDEQ